MNLKLENRNCVILGGSRGIGRSIAISLADEGANVAICALAVMHAQQGIRANAIAPGSIEFPGGVWAAVKENQPESYESVKDSIPAGRLGPRKR